MAKRFQKAFITSLIFSQVFINPAISQADSIILNKNTTDGVNVRIKEDVNSEILGGIEDFTPYEIKSETDDWYEIEFEGKKAREWKVFGLVILAVLVCNILASLVEVQPAGFAELLNSLF